MEFVCKYLKTTRPWPAFAAYIVCLTYPWLAGQHPETKATEKGGKHKQRENVMISNLLLSSTVAQCASVSISPDAFSTIFPPFVSTTFSSTT